MAVTTATSTETFLDLARRSGAVDSRRLDAFIGRYGGPLPEDPAQVAEELIQSGLLTRYQAEPLLQGQARRFMLSGKYRLLDRLGAGGMASVFLCEHKIMRRRVAIKMLPPNLAKNPSMLDRFHREARAIASVHHPNIVGAHDVDQDGNINFLVMEYVEGTNFHELVRRAGPLNIERAAHYISQACLGLQHAHDKGLVHRDIKPANLLVDRAGVVKILDLGLALVFQGDDDNLTRDHDANSILGTAEYLAPEQAIDSHGVDHRADIYSLGMTLYFLLTGETPYGEGTTAQKLIWHQLRQPRPIRGIRSDVPEELWVVLQKMLAKAPGDRYQSGREVAQALAPWTANPIPPPTDSEMPKPAVQFSDAMMTDGGYSSQASDGGYGSLGGGAMLLPTPLDVVAGGGSSATAKSSTSGTLSGTGYNTPKSSPKSAPPMDLSPQPMDLAPPAPAPAVDLAPPPAPASSSPPAKSTPPASAPPASASPKSGPKLPSAPPASTPPAATAPAAAASAIASAAPVVARAAPVAKSASSSSSGAMSAVKTSTEPAAKAVADEDTEDNAPASGKYRKKAKRKAEEEAKKKQKMMILAGVGGIVGLLAIGGILWATLGGSGKKPVALGTFATSNPGTQTSPTPTKPKETKPTPTQPKETKPAPTQPKETKPTPPATTPTPPATTPTPPTKPKDPVPQPLQTAGAEFFPMKAHSVLFDISQPLATPSGPAWTVVRQKLMFKDNGEVDVTLVQTGITKSLDTPPARWQQLNRAAPSMQVRKTGDLIEFGTLLDAKTKTMFWEPILKIGAKKGDTWKGQTAGGEPVQYALVDFGTHVGKPSATVRASQAVKAAGNFPAGEVVVIRKFAKDIGEVERTASFHYKDNTGKDQTLQQLHVRYVGAVE